MAQKPDGKSAKTEQVSFTRPAAERIAKVVRTVEAGRRDCRPLKIHGMPQQATSKIFRVATFTGAWAVDTSRAVTFRNVTATPNTVQATNLLISLPEASPHRICNIAKDGTAWYLVGFRAVADTAVFARQTHSIVYVGTAATQAITYASPGSAVTVLTDISAVLNTSSCVITVAKTTASVQVVGATQTATIISTTAMQSAVAVRDTYTATYIKLEL